jgi:hypothetical protein
MAGLMGKVLTFTRRATPEPGPPAYTCIGCDSQVFYLLTDGQVYCAGCNDHMYRFTVTRDDTPDPPSA